VFLANRSDSLQPQRISGAGRGQGVRPEALDLTRNSLPSRIDLRTFSGKELQDGMEEGVLGQTHGLLEHPGYRFLLGARLASAAADGLFQATLLLSLVFLSGSRQTLTGYALATAILLLPFSVIGPFTGVFIDRWRRRRVLVNTPLLRGAASLLVLAGGTTVPVYLGALVVFSANRFYLATVSTVVPRVVPSGSLLQANSVMATVGTTSTFVGLVAGGVLADVLGAAPTLILACAGLLLAALLAKRIPEDLAPQCAPHAPLRSALGSVGRELIDGLRLLRATPGARVPILAISAQQILQWTVIVGAVVLLKEVPGRGLSAFSLVTAAGGVGVFAGFVTVGLLARVVSKPNLMGLSFVASGVALVPAAAYPALGSLLVSVALLGVCYAWAKIPADTLVQNAVPDAYRGRVFTLYDLAFNLGRVLAACVAIPLLPELGLRLTFSVVAVLFVAAGAVVPAWVSGGSPRGRRGTLTGPRTGR
jgi:predicted MFS family arabinose efflux permease